MVKQNIFEWAHYSNEQQLWTHNNINNFKNNVEFNLVKV